MPGTVLGILVIHRKENGKLDVPGSTLEGGSAVLYPKHLKPPCLLSGREWGMGRGCLKCQLQDLPLSQATAPSGALQKSNFLLNSRQVLLNSSELKKHL